MQEEKPFIAETQHTHLTNYTITEWNPGNVNSRRAFLKQFPGTLQRGNMTAHVRWYLFLTRECLYSVLFFSGVVLFHQSFVYILIFNNKDSLIESILVCGQNSFLSKVVLIFLLCF